jgi:hypothetical protein
MTDDEQSLSDLEREILRHVAAHDGEWYWYQLDREIVAKDPTRHSGKLMPAIKRLQTASLLEILPNPNLGDVPRYWITNAGKLAIASLHT